MVAAVKKIRIFLASRGDLKEERASVKETIDELNITFGPIVNCIFELRMWETHSGPGIDESDSQNVIDNDIAAVDIFIGMFWNSFGTPTKNAPSGTIHEFNNAFRQFQSDPTSIKILFYFKTAPPHSMSLIDPISLQKINQFKGELRGKNVFYGEFREIQNLQKSLRIIIPLRIQESANGIAPNNTPKIDEDFGLLDYLDLFQAEIALSTQSTNRFAESTSWIGQQISLATLKIERIKAKKEISSNELRKICIDLAKSINTYIEEMEAELPNFINSFSSSMNAQLEVRKIANDDLEVIPPQELEEFDVVLEYLDITIEGTINSFQSFVDEVSNLPRIEKTLNKAKRKVEEMLNNFIVTMKFSKTLLKNFE